MSADGSIVIETNIDDKNAQRELTRLNKQIKSIEDQLASKKQGRLPLENNLNSVNAKLDEARKRLAMLQDEQNAINSAMQAGATADDYMRAYSDSPMVEAALKQQQAEVDAIEKEWKQADKALSAYDSKISGLEAKLNSARRRPEVSSRIWLKLVHPPKRWQNPLTRRRKVQVSSPCVCGRSSGVH